MFRKDGNPPIPSKETLETKRACLGADFQPNNYCVLCGRGKDCFNSVGNRRFRVIVSMFLERYKQADNKTKKSQIVTEVMDTVRGSGGAFVKLENGVWFEVGDAVAREKVGALFRDSLHEQYRSSGKSKAARRADKKKSADTTDEYLLPDPVPSVKKESAFTKDDLELFHRLSDPVPSVKKESAYTTDDLEPFHLLPDPFPCVTSSTSEIHASEWAPTPL